MKRSRKITLVILAAMGLMMLAGCARRGHLPGDNPPMMEEIPNQEIDPEWEAKQEETYNPHYTKDSRNKPFIDYASFDDYGEWSCDRLWVKKTEATWDSVAEYYGYIDTEGNLVGEWHPVNQDISDQSNYRDLNMAYDALMNDELHGWDYCRDFVGGFAINPIGTYQDSAGMYTATYCPMLEIVNKNGEVVHSFLPLEYARDKSTSMKYEFNFVNYMPIFYVSTAAAWNADGSYAGEVPAMYIIFPEGNDVREVRIEGSYGEGGFYNVDHFMNDLGNRMFVNGYCSMIDWDGSRAYLFDENGKTVFWYEFDYRITQLYVNDEVVSMYFIGADGKTTYCVDMDFNGNWLNEPTAVD